MNIIRLSHCDQRCSFSIDGVEIKNVVEVLISKGVGRKPLIELSLLPEEETQIEFESEDVDLLTRLRKNYSRGKQ